MNTLWICAAAIILVPHQVLTQVVGGERRATVINEIPAEGAGYRFSIVAGIERLLDGRFVAIEAVDPQLLVFDSNGNFVRTLGRPGDGPGEFRWPQAIGLSGDSLWVGDATHQRITLFTPSLKLAGTETATIQGIPARTAKGNTVVRSLKKLSSAPIHQSITVVTRSHNAIDTVASVPDKSPALVIDVDGMQRLSTQPFTDAPLVQVSRDGRGVVVVTRYTPAKGPHAVRVEKIGIDGFPGFDIRLPYTAEKVSQRLIDAEVATHAEVVRRRKPDMAQNEIDRRVRSALVIPDHAPSVSALATGRDGMTWLRRVSDGRSPVQWTVLDPRGRVAFKTHLPPDAELLWADGDLLAATRQGEDGVPRIVIYRLK